jgi:negative regulator of sigma E activity
VTAKATSPYGNIVEDVESEKQQQRHPFFATLRRSTAAAAAAAAVAIATGSDAAFADAIERGVPPPPTNGPLKNLPRGAYA